MLAEKGSVSRSNSCRTDLDMKLENEKFKGFEKRTSNVLVVNVQHSEVVPVRYGHHRFRSVSLRPLSCRSQPYIGHYIFKLG